MIEKKAEKNKYLQILPFDSGNHGVRIRKFPLN